MDRTTAVTTWREVCGNDAAMAMPPTGRMLEEFARRIADAEREAGAKLDAGKNRVGLVLFGFALALQEVSKVGTYGANKYTDNGWMEVPDGERRYTDAMLRHLMREASGEVCDPDTGLRHAAHAAWNALARLDLALRQAPNAPHERAAEGGPLDAVVMPQTEQRSEK